MIHASIGDTIGFNARRSLATLHVEDHSFVSTVGFEGELQLDGFEEMELEASYLTVILSELRPHPSATPAEIRDVVEGFDRDNDPAYEGHDAALVAGLFPAIRVFRAIGSPASHWGTFFRLCVDEGEFVGMWRDLGVASALRELSNRDAERIPYQVLCRSIFDGDPTTLFLALYRCLERLYSYSNAKELMHALEIGKEWDTVAAALEDTLGWYPREEGSLAKLLKLAKPSDLGSFLTIIQEGPQDETDLARTAARQIYLLRNSIVHYRPSHAEMRIENFDWDALSQSMAEIVLNVYVSVFGTA